MSEKEKEKKEKEKEKEKKKKRKRKRKKGREREREKEREKERKRNTSVLLISNDVRSGSSVRTMILSRRGCFHTTTGNLYNHSKVKQNFSECVEVNFFRFVPTRKKNQILTFFSFDIGHTSQFRHHSQWMEQLTSEDT
jgi:hypothetical protein